MKKKILVLCLLLLSVLTAVMCSHKKEYFGFREKDFSVVEQEDSHGGFHGDGTAYVILDCSQNREKALELIADWNALPLSENLNLMFYGGERDGVYYDFDLAQQANMPKVEHGFYYFQDRHRKSADSSSDADIFDRGSYNFSLAVYDSATDRLYYFELDT